MVPPEYDVHVDERIPVISSLLVICPTRGRKENCERLLKSFEMNTDDADLVFVTDGDDQDSYDGMDWGSALHAQLDPRDTLSGKLNQTANACVNDYDALMFVGDDHVFRTRNWDELMKIALDDMGDTGILCPDGRRKPGMPESWLMSSDIVKELGWLACPSLQHFHLDDVIAELGKRSQLIQGCPEVIIEHLHYTTGNAPKDEIYSYAENTWGISDEQAYQQWRATVMPHQIAVLRRKFNPDVKWALSQI